MVSDSYYSWPCLLKTEQTRSRQAASDATSMAGNVSSLQSAMDGLGTFIAGNNFGFTAFVDEIARDCTCCAIVESGDCCS